VIQLLQIKNGNKIIAGRSSWDLKKIIGTFSPVQLLKEKLNFLRMSKELVQLRN
jgi:hypothetical protein